LLALVGGDDSASTSLREWRQSLFGSSSRARRYGFQRIFAFVLVVDFLDWQDYFEL